jgi:hypothetical protein
VAQDSKESGFGTSKLLVSKNHGEFAKARVATAPTVIVCGINRWHRISGFGTWEAL